MSLPVPTARERPAWPGNTKSGLGWPDVELYDGFSCNLQVRYAPGYRILSEGHFELRTLYHGLGGTPELAYLDRIIPQS